MNYIKCVTVILMLCLAFPSHANACIMAVPFEVHDIAKADIVFLGKLRSYERLPNEYSMAKLQFDVQHTYRGKASKFIDIVWQNSTYGVPLDKEKFLQYYGEELIIGILNAEDQLPLRAPSAYIPGYKNQELKTYPLVLQAPCSSPFMFSKEGLHELGLNEADLK